LSPLIPHYTSLQRRRSGRTLWKGNRSGPDRLATGRLIWHGIPYALACR
jgi:hypothetical protein